MSILDLIELAKIGRRHIVKQSQKNVIHWLGTLPTEDDIDAAQHVLDQIFDPHKILPSGNAEITA